MTSKQKNCPLDSVAVAYRIYPKVSKAPFVFKDDKFELAEVCLKSFKSSLIGCKVKIWVLLDGCPPSYKRLFLKYFKKSELIFIDLNSYGNHKTFDLQLDILKSQNFSEVVYFAEDDYVYLPAQFKKMLNLMNVNENIDFITPYDHLDYYTSEFAQDLSDIYLTHNHHWKRAGSTCLTFLARKAALIHAEACFRSYKKGNRDVSIWASITKHKVFNFSQFIKNVLKLNLSYCRIIMDAWRFSSIHIIFRKKQILVSPIPSLATHAESLFLAPTINWTAYVRRKLKKSF
jgi:hypothetical protein